MEVLILSCGTGGGHNSAAEAVREECQRRGWGVTMLNPLSLRGEKLARRVDSAYIDLAQAAPGGFGAIYAIGNAYRRLPWRSPVYFANGHAADALGAYLNAHPVDVVVMTHLFPAEMLTYLKNHGHPIPKTLFITTDYTCIPFMEEIDCDAYVTPSPMLTGEFAAWGIPQEKLYPLGIPVRSSFRQPLSKEEAKKALQLEMDKRYLLAAGGSIGAGKLEKAIELLCQVTDGTSYRLIVICGSNRSVCRHLEKRFGDRVQLIEKTDAMAGYLRACDLYLTKPGGLSTTEAAVMEVPLALLPPIPGCEDRNRRFFTETGMAWEAELSKDALRQLLSASEQEEKLEQLRRRQQALIPKDAAEKICELANVLVS